MLDAAGLARAAARTPATFAPIVSMPLSSTPRTPRAPPRRRRASRVIRARQCSRPVPRDRPLQALVEIDLRLEAELLARLRDVRHPDLDVGVVQRLEDDLAGRAGQALDALRQVVDRHRRARVADVEALARGLRALEAEQERLDHVVDVAPGADLRAVAVDRQVPAGERRLDEGADRAAADLARAVDVERPDGDRRQGELVVVGVRHVLARELRDGVGPARLADRADRRHVPLGRVDRVRAEDLARRELDQALERVLRRERRLQHVVGADHVHPHRPHRALEHVVDAGDRRAVDDVRRARGELAHRVRVEEVGRVELEVGVLGEIGARERVAVQVVERDDVVRVDEAAREGRADEPGAAGDQDPLAAQCHAAKPSGRTLYGSMLLAATVDRDADDHALSVRKRAGRSASGSSAAPARRSVRGSRPAGGRSSSRRRRARRARRSTAGRRRRSSAAG